MTAKGLTGADWLFDRIDTQYIQRHLLFAGTVGASVHELQIELEMLVIIAVRLSDQGTSVAMVGSGVGRDLLFIHVSLWR